MTSGAKSKGRFGKQDFRYDAVQDIYGAYQNNGSFRKFQGGERVLVAPRISYRPTEWTDITIDGQFLGQRAQSDIGVPTIGWAPANLPFYRSFQEANDPRDHVESFNLGYRFGQNIDPHGARRSSNPSPPSVLRICNRERAFACPLAPELDSA
jgi:hypothetical protein